jgi:hypothetical protein
MPIRAIEAYLVYEVGYCFWQYYQEKTTMFQREIRAHTQTCPDCGSKLTADSDLLQCKEHGAFFAYGPQLLVRVPRQISKSSEQLMPWEREGNPPRLA